MNQDTKKNITTAELTKISLCVALCCVTSFIYFPLPFTPGMVTALTLAMSLSAYILPPKQTFLVILVYILLGVAGLPIFAGSGGVGKLVSPVGGFYLAWFLAYPVLSALKGNNPNLKRYALANIFLTMPITYAGGLLSMYLLLDITIWQAVAMAVLPYIPGDVMKTLAAAFLGMKINSAVRNDIILKP